MTLPSALLGAAVLWMGAWFQAQEACRLVPLEMGSVHACTSGHGPVSVVLAAGAGQTSRTWAALVPELSSSARVVTFDRPGLGDSPPSGSSRTPTRIALELRALLDSLGANDQLVLVGHSMGGVHVLRFASLYPEEVAGVVIIDTPPPGFEEARMELLSPTERDERRRVLERSLRDAPETVRREREGARGGSEWDFSTFPPAVPLAVVVADSQDFGDVGGQAAHRRLWAEGSASWTGLSHASHLTVANGSGHMVHHDRRQLVMEEILAMIATVGDTEGSGQ